MSTDSDKKALRKSLYINRAVQGQLIVKSVIQWFFYLCAILLTVVIWTVIQNPSKSAIGLVFEAFTFFSPAIVASILILPLFVWDMLKESNRIAGPIHRLQQEMKKLQNGEAVNNLEFRDGDYWLELAEDFNALAATVAKLRSQNNAKEDLESALV